MVTWQHLLVILSSLLVIAGASAYIYNTLKGRTKPNRVSWFLWAFFPLVGTGAAIQAHADLWSSVRVFLGGFLPLLIFLASFLNKKSYWRLKGFDWLCGGCAILSLIVWIILEDPQIAIIFAVIGDVFALLPTLTKAWKHPETETGITYIAGILASLLVFPSVPTWNIPNGAFQIYLILANLALAFAVYRKKLFHSFH